ncbi:unnamed protein product [Oppiella nova]|uniref:Uncharacterized protein n=1 Tax=Oppiella nova TaxID=334625 RepID=A0A7R9M712_9ACAR|nr:unnamed protein product [Oppiella nova]CAG2170772.1 unnamed protein product [Oppiella nova]
MLWMRLLGPGYIMLAYIGLLVALQQGVHPVPIHVVTRVVTIIVALIATRNVAIRIFKIGVDAQVDTSVCPTRLLYMQFPVWIILLLQG